MAPLLLYRSDAPVYRFPSPSNNFVSEIGENRSACAELGRERTCSQRYLKNFR